MAEIYSIKQFTDMLHSDGMDPGVTAILNDIFSWASCVVRVPIESRIQSNAFNQRFIEWRSGREIRRHTKLAWLPNCFFFESESDALMFMLTFSDISINTDS